MAIRFNENQARVMGRTAAGVKGIDLRTDDAVIGLIRADDDADLLTVTENGYGKRTALREYLVQSEDGSTRAQSRGGKGRRDIQVNERNGRAIAIRAVHESDGIMFIGAKGMMVRVAVSSISRIGRNTQGVRVVNLKEGDTLIAAARVVENDDEQKTITPPEATAKESPDSSPESSPE